MKIMNCFVLITFLRLVSANFIAKSANSVTSNLIDKVIDVTSKYYKHYYVTSVVWTQDNLAGVSDFLKKYPGIVVIIQLSDEDNSVIDDANQDIANKYEWTVIFVTDPNSFEKFLNLVNEKLRIPIHVVLVLEEPVSDVKDLTTYNKIAWQNDLVDLVILSKNYADEITLSTYFPFNKGICGNDVPVTLNFDENLFPNKYKNVNKCSLRVFAINFPPFVDLVFENGKIVDVRGHDGITLRILANKLNATLEIEQAPIDSSYGSYLNGTATGALGYLVDKNADLLIPFGILTRDRYLVSQISHVHHTVDSRWIGPKRREVGSSIKLLRPFINIVTPLLCLSFISFVIVAILIRKRTQSRQIKRMYICFNTYALFLGQPTKYVTKVPLLNNLFLLWVWFSLIVYIDYQSDLVKFLQNVILEPPLGSIEKAVSTVDGYGGSDAFLNFYRGTPLESEFKVLSLNDINTYLKRIIDGERFLLAVDAFLVRNFRESVQILNTQISSASSCFYMRPGWPGAKNVDTIILTLVEAGIIDESINHDDVLYRNTTNNDAKVHGLDISMLISCFYGIGLMSVVCLIIFVIEVFCDRHDRCKQKYKTHPRLERA